MQTVTTDKRESYGYKAVVVSDYIHTYEVIGYNRNTGTYEKGNRQVVVPAGAVTQFCSKADLANAISEGAQFKVDFVGDVRVPTSHLKLYRVDNETVITRTVTETEI